MANTQSSTKEREIFVHMCMETEERVTADCGCAYEVSDTEPCLNHTQCAMHAAAPTMLEALEEIAGYRGSLYDNPKLNDWADVALLLKERARAAIEAAS